MSLYLISGGPGAGKSTLLNALREHGYAGAEEVSRQLIQEQVALGSELVPWQNLAGFADLALARMIAQHQQAQMRGEVTFFDRGIPDIMAYLKLGGLPVAPHFHQAAAAFPYERRVLMAPPWRAIYVNDAERWQTYAEAVRLHAALVHTYEQLGYEVVALPRVPVAARVAFVLEQLPPH